MIRSAGPVTSTVQASVVPLMSAIDSLKLTPKAILRFPLRRFREQTTRMRVKNARIRVYQNEWYGSNTPRVFIREKVDSPYFSI